MTRPRPPRAETDRSRSVSDLERRAPTEDLELKSACTHGRHVAVVSTRALAELRAELDLLRRNQSRDRARVGRLEQALETVRRSLSLAWSRLLDGRRPRVDGHRRVDGAAI